MSIKDISSTLLANMDKVEQYLENIRTSLKNKGVDAADGAKLSEIASLIDSIEVSSSGGGEFSFQTLGTVWPDNVGRYSEGYNMYAKVIKLNKQNYTTEVIVDCVGPAVPTPAPIADGPVITFERPVTPEDLIGDEVYLVIYITNSEDNEETWADAPWLMLFTLDKQSMQNNSNTDLFIYTIGSIEMN